MTGPQLTILKAISQSGDSSVSEIAAMMDAEHDNSSAGPSPGEQPPTMKDVHRPGSP